jgi:hypothetical protein
MSDKSYIMRMCRVDGQKPTSRDRWKAFYRLYRITMKHDDLRYASRDRSGLDALRMLNNDWVARLNETDLLSDGGMPVFLRKRFVEMAKRRRAAKRQLLADRLLEAIMRPV